jgi:carbon-monoxide dehydrogenase medium subunit
MPLWSEYYLPVSVDKPLDSWRYDGGRVVAGGTGLILSCSRAERGGTLVDDAHRRAERIREGGYLVIGAGVTQADRRECALQREGTALVGASYVVGGPQVTIATISGNVAHALPAADGTTALNALDAGSGGCVQRALNPDCGVIPGAGQVGH